jgi:hypothetical protein
MDGPGFCFPSGNLVRAVGPWIEADGPVGAAIVARPEQAHVFQHTVLQVRPAQVGVRERRAGKVCQRQPRPGEIGTVQPGAL